MTTVLVSPVAEEQGATPAFSPAPRRFDRLDGLTVGLLDSTKHNSDHLLAALGRLLAERYPLKGVIQEAKPYFGNPVPDDQAASLAARCDVVITGVGD